jgi:hypothetical protein
MYLEIYKAFFISQTYVITAAEGWKVELSVYTFIIIYEVVHQKLVIIPNECFIWNIWTVEQQIRFLEK